MEIDFDNNKPILIAGPTASGKSALGITLARRYKGVVINADALQVYRQWQILTARPDETEQSQCPHWMYGHVNIGAPYSAGHWLNDIRECLDQARNDGLRPIILGGTGLYFQVLTQGIADIPEIPQNIKDKADQIEATDGKQTFRHLLESTDEKTSARIDMQNPMRTRRAWEVLTATGKGMADWQDETPPPLLSPDDCIGVNLISDKSWLNDRIDRRFDMMIDMGALDECQAVFDAGLWDENHPSCRAIGAKELLGHLTNGDDLEQAIEASKIQTRQYAKRQRTWFRSKMRNWHQLELANT
jgi:tRNA dimethylallyltransferase